MSHTLSGKQLLLKMRCVLLFQIFGRHLALIMDQKIRLASERLNNSWWSFSENRSLRYLRCHLAASRQKCDHWDRYRYLFVALKQLHISNLKIALWFVSFPGSSLFQEEVSCYNARLLAFRNALRTTDLRSHWHTSFII